MPHITTSDGTRIYYEEQGQGRPLILIHGWTFSGRFFHRNIGPLSEQTRVITLDLRGHGRSDKPRHGYRVSRLAADLQDLLIALNINDATVLGWSLGCPVIWSYLELFGRERIRNAIFVQQTPRQYYSADWKYGHAICYDQAGLASLQQQLSLTPEAFDRTNLKSCLCHDLPKDEEAFLLQEMAESPAFARSPLMADHTNADWRDVLPRFQLRAIMMVAKKDTVLDPRGPEWVAQNMPNCKPVYFEDSAHMIFLDETEKFNQTVLSFLNGEI
ncbi:alpha/beta fold hydrolase [Gluconobacter morbifer]|uniref:Putative peroxidase n=1 Tax=Gluconobacter morbifer G707 TaxID=1088869 RepID=G6XLW5_9PROT|nr:alpha/beta hydrolase [Gluconobacter morbifer]EHH67370.1 putative peroxidase [Gluconobacter morbifer G707]